MRAFCLLYTLELRSKLMFENELFVRLDKVEQKRQKQYLLKNLEAEKIERREKVGDPQCIRNNLIHSIAPRKIFLIADCLVGYRFFSCLNEGYLFSLFVN